MFENRVDLGRHSDKHRGHRAHRENTKIILIDSQVTTRLGMTNVCNQCTNEFNCFKLHHLRQGL